MTSKFEFLKFKNAIAEASQNLREHNRDQYLSLLLIKSLPSRAALTLLYGFYQEIIDIPQKVSEPMLGEIRLTWWREVLEKKRQDEVLGHELAFALISVLDFYELSNESLINLIEAQRFDLYQDPMPSMNDLEGFAGETDGKILQLAAMILTKESGHVLNDEALSVLANACGHGGVALCLSAKLKNLYDDCPLEKQYFPNALLEAAGTNSQKLFQRVQSDENANFIAMACAIAKTHKGKALEAVHALPKSLRPAFRQLALCDYDLDRIEKLGAKILKMPLPQTPIRRQWRLWRF